MWTLCIPCSSASPSIDVKSACRVRAGCSFRVLAGCGLPAREVSKLPFHKLGSQEFNSDAESHFQRCYSCIILQLGISVAQVNQLSLHLCTNKNLFPFPKTPSSSHNYSLGSGFFSYLLPIVCHMLRYNWLCSHFILPCLRVPPIGIQGLAMVVEKGQESQS